MQHSASLQQAHLLLVLLLQLLPLRRRRTHAAHTSLCKLSHTRCTFMRFLMLNSPTAQTLPAPAGMRFWHWEG